MATSAICKIKHEAHCQDANKARGEVECFIGHRGSAPSALFYVSQELDYALTVLKDLPINALKKIHPFQYTRRYPLFYAK